MCVVLLLLVNGIPNQLLNKYNDSNGSSRMGCVKLIITTSLENVGLDGDVEIIG